MNKKQLAAIARLERAMSAVEKAGLLLAGVDCYLICFPRREYEKINKDRVSPSEIINELDHHIIQCPYTDSGGA